MIGCSFPIFAFIKFGGVVGLEIRKTVIFKDFLVGIFLFLFLACYYRYKFYVVAVKDQDIADMHLVHVVGNFLLLEMIILNESAMTYWGKIRRRWWNNLEVQLRRDQVRAPGTKDLPCPVNTWTRGRAPGGRWCAPQGPGRSLGGRAERRDQDIVQVEDIEITEI